MREDAIWVALHKIWEDSSSSGRILRALQPVSYTHLDVYKRQAEKECSDFSDIGCAADDCLYHLSV